MTADTGDVPLKVDVPLTEDAAQALIRLRARDHLSDVAAVNRALRAYDVIMGMAGADGAVLITSTDAADIQNVVVLCP